MKRIVTTLMLTVMVCCLYATAADDGLACSQAPDIDWTIAIITRSEGKKGKVSYTTLKATWPKNDTQIMVKQELIGDVKNYVGEHFFVVSKNGKEAYLGDEILGTYAEKLFNECSALYAQQEATKRVVIQTKRKRSGCSLQ